MYSQQGTLEVFGASVATGVRVGLHQTFTEALKTIILPGYEKANAELFKQLYETFNQGTVACKYRVQVGREELEFRSQLITLLRFESTGGLHENVRADPQ